MSKIDALRDLRGEMKQLKDVRHDNNYIKMIVCVCRIFMMNSSMNFNTSYMQGQQAQLTNYHHQLFHLVFTVSLNYI